MVNTCVRNIYLLIIYSLFAAALRPANTNPSKQTNGRKSNKRALRKHPKEEDLDAPDEDEAQLVEENAPHASRSQAKTRTLK